MTAKRSKVMKEEIVVQAECEHGGKIRVKAFLSDDQITAVVVTFDDHYSGTLLQLPSLDALLSLHQALSEMIGELDGNR